MITLYDFDGKAKGVPWNPNVWKTRYSLNYKGLPYKTVLIEYPDVEPTMKKINAPPTAKKADGSPLYTIPAIYDDSTGTAIADSILIAEYLDKTYPSTPRLIPQGTHALQGAFGDFFFSKMMPLLTLTLPDVPLMLLNPRSAEYFEKARSADFGVPTLEAFRVPPEAKDAAWDKVKDALGTLNALMKDGDTWVMGDAPSFADFVMGGLIGTVKSLYGKESEEWKRIMSWHGGRWQRLMVALEKYSASAVPTL
ncbi:hypothetical protein BT96DRAFT_855270 [Gymnopus androsaceus JB14]|uniref:GST N-terminal domain-containing protein n=1 Tax=Gymnopus androsaceus JB14 TaxID=1447944 RepID=A0A6A4I0I9_9AGAR|nr:hypothetical protein BT96DRAFT_855270 [Gymnopus androsaceus JB14]